MVDLGAISQYQARQLAGKSWVINGMIHRFKDCDEAFPGEPPWLTGEEGIVYPLLDDGDNVVMFVKLFDEYRLTEKRIARTKWLVERRIHREGAQLASASKAWLETKVIGRPEGISFDFACSMMDAAPGRTWYEVKMDIMDAQTHLDETMQRRCVADVVQAAASLEELGFVHGDLSPSNVVISMDASPKDAALSLVDFDAFVAPAAGELKALAMAEGGVPGTIGYCPPGIKKRQMALDGTVSPVSDRYGRDMLLLEFLCFDATCECDDPPSEWDIDRLQTSLSESPLAGQLSHLKVPKVFELGEDARPSSRVLAEQLGLGLHE